ncbi:hypothetical protein M422DRAFT_255573 [Sphaerobolus stellatus SS14]|uniref:Terpene synthase n=1 Tax=Sphaerobolus stellatus (strain SS14) TaxID=990650 RepID=A0A0C9UEH9_SPHS4|nr:hypothetical protein M422DRAFT_255573 [Sphaerobolus stellatus SS14]
MTSTSRPRLFKFPSSGSFIKALGFDSFKPNVPSRITPRLHPQTNEVISRVDEWFLKHWPFPNEAAREEFQSSDIALFTCYTMPDALNERIELACKMVNLMFLFDDVMDNWSIEEAQGFYKKFAELILGDEDVHPVTQLEKLLHGLFAEIRGIGTLGQDFCEAVIRWFKLAASHARSQWKSSGDILEYCEYRIVDAGFWLTVSMIRCAMDLQHPQRDDQVVSECEHLAGYHAMLINDLFSYRREVLRTSAGEIGAALINSISVVQNSRGIEEQEAMMWLESYCEKLEGQFEEVASTTTHLGEDANRYIDALRLLMVGNLKWSTVCGRYNIL